MNDEQCAQLVVEKQSFRFSIHNSAFTIHNSYKLFAGLEVDPVQEVARRKPFAPLHLEFFDFELRPLAAGNDESSSLGRERSRLQWGRYWRR